MRVEGTKDAVKMGNAGGSWRGGIEGNNGPIRMVWRIGRNKGRKEEKCFKNKSQSRGKRPQGGGNRSRDARQSGGRKGRKG